VRDVRWVTEHMGSTRLFKIFLQKLVTSNNKGSEHKNLELNNRHYVGSMNSYCNKQHNQLDDYSVLRIIKTGLDIPLTL